MTVEMLRNADKLSVIFRPFARCLIPRSHWHRVVSILKLKIVKKHFQNFEPVHKNILVLETWVQIRSNHENSFKHFMKMPLEIRVFCYYIIYFVITFMTPRCHRGRLGGLNDVIEFLTIWHRQTNSSPLFAKFSQYFLWNVS